MPMKSHSPSKTPVHGTRPNHTESTPRFRPFTRQAPYRLYIVA